MNTICNACLLGIKENPVTGIIFTLVMIILASFPGFLLFVFVKSVQRWGNYEYAKTAGDHKALKPPSTRSAPRTCAVLAGRWPVPSAWYWPAWNHCAGAGHQTVPGLRPE